LDVVGCRLPALFSLLMLLTYSIIMGIAYSALNLRGGGGLVGFCDTAKS
jgi:hypothetical protein